MATTEPYNPNPGGLNISGGNTGEAEAAGFVGGGTVQSASSAPAVAPVPGPTLAATPAPTTTTTTPPTGTPHWNGWSGGQQASSQETLNDAPRNPGNSSWQWGQNGPAWQWNSANGAGATTPFPPSGATASPPVSTPFQSEPPGAANGAHNDVMMAPTTQLGGVNAQQGYGGGLNHIATLFGIPNQTQAAAPTTPTGPVQG